MGGCKPTDTEKMKTIVLFLYRIILFLVPPKYLVFQSNNCFSISKRMFINVHNIFAFAAKMLLPLELSWVSVDLTLCLTAWARSNDRNEEKQFCDTATAGRALSKVMLWFSERAYFKCCLILHSPIWLQTDYRLQIALCCLLVFWRLEAMTECIHSSHFSSSAVKYNLLKVLEPAYKSRLLNDKLCEVTGV